MALPPLVLRIIADSTGVKAGVAQAQAQVSGLRGAFKKHASAIKGALALGIVAGLAKSVDEASKLHEQINRNNEVFEKSAAGMEKWSKTTASAFGIAQSESLQAASNFGAMFDSAGLLESKSAAMSKVLVELSSDMASFNDQDPSEMLDRMQSALAGQGRVLRPFGVFLSENALKLEANRIGMEALNGEFTDAQKVQLRYNIILQQTKKQQGDFQRTLGTSAPNQMRALRAQFKDLGAAVGKYVLPALVHFVHGLNQIVGGIITTVHALQQAYDWTKNKLVAAWRFVRGPVLAVIHAIVWAVKGLIAIVQGAIDALQFLAKLGGGSTPIVGGRPASSLGRYGGVTPPLASATPTVSHAPKAPLTVNVRLDRKQYVNEADYDYAYSGVG